MGRRCGRCRSRGKVSHLSYVQRPKVLRGYQQTSIDNPTMGSHRTILHPEMVQAAVGYTGNRSRQKYLLALWRTGMDLGQYPRVWSVSVQERVVAKRPKDSRK